MWVSNTNRGSGRLELTKQKITITRIMLRGKAEEDASQREHINTKVNLPVEKVMCGILHRMIMENRGDKTIGCEESSGICEVFERQPAAGEH
jgi:hypothetical protein